MNKNDRRKRMLAELKTRGSIKIMEQASQYDVTPETIRRDIENLSKEGLLVRTYGGAILSSIAHEPSVHTRSNVNARQRELIAIEAAKLVENMSVIMIDGGSTTLFFANELVTKLANQVGLVLTVITNSYDIARALSQCAAIRVIMCPGDFDSRENAVFGSRVAEFLAEFTADAVVFSAGGISNDGVMDVHSLAAWVKREMLRQADQAILMVDDRKFDAKQLERVCDLAAIDSLVTNEKPPHSINEALQTGEVTVHLPPRNQ